MTCALFHKAKTANNDKGSAYGFNLDMSLIFLLKISAHNVKPSVNSKAISTLSDHSRLLAKGSGVTDNDKQIKGVSDGVELRAFLHGRVYGQ